MSVGSRIAWLVQCIEMTHTSQTDGAARTNTESRTANELRHFLLVVVFAFADAISAAVSPHITCILNAIRAHASEEQLFFREFLTNSDAEAIMLIQFNHSQP